MIFQMVANIKKKKVYSTVIVSILNVSFDSSSFDICRRCLSFLIFSLYVISQLNVKSAEMLLKTLRQKYGIHKRVFRKQDWCEGTVVKAFSILSKFGSVNV